jgi:hypothetical protein
VSKRVMSQRDVDLRDARRMVARTGRVAAAAYDRHWLLARKTERALKRLRDTHNKWEEATDVLDELLGNKT